MRIDKYLHGRTVSKRATPGERVMGSLFTPNLYGWGGWGSDNLYEQVQHYRQWTYVGIHAICKKVASLMPNFAYVSSHERAGHTVKAGQRGLMNLTGRGGGGTPWFGDEAMAASSLSNPKGTSLKQFGTPNYTSKWEPSAPCSSGGSFLTIGEYQSKALSVIKPHEHIEPLEHDHPLRRLWDNPNPYDTAFDFGYELCMFLMLTGSTYPWMVPNSMPDPKPCELWVMPSHWTWPRTGGGSIMSLGGNGKVASTEDSPIDADPRWWQDSDRIIKYYEIRPWGTVGTAGMLKIPPSDMAMVKWKSPLDKIRGYSPLGAIAQWIDSEESITKSRWAQFQNIARPDLFIKLGAGYEDASDDQIERVSAKIDQKLRGEYNYGRTMIGTPGMEVTPLSWNPSEMAYGESEEHIRDMILSALGVPKAWVGIVSEMTFGSILATLMQACEGCVNPYLSMMGMALTKHLASRWDDERPAWSTLQGQGHGASGYTRYVKMWWDNCTPADPAQVNSDIQTDLQGKAITPSEIRALRGRERYKHGGDDPMGSAGDVPIPLNTGDDLEDLAKLMAPMEGGKDTVAGTERLADEGISDTGKTEGQPGEASGTKPSPSANEKPPGVDNVTIGDVMDDMSQGGKIDKPNSKPSKSQKSSNPYQDNGCPICGEHATSSCRCMGPHTPEQLAKGHGLRCPNGHQFDRNSKPSKGWHDSNMNYHSGEMPPKRQPSEIERQVKQEVEALVTSAQMDQTAKQRTINGVEVYFSFHKGKERWIVSGKGMTRAETIRMLVKAGKEQKKSWSSLDDGGEFPDVEDELPDDVDKSVSDDAVTAFNDALRNFRDLSFAEIEQRITHAWQLVPINEVKAVARGMGITVSGGSRKSMIDDLVRYVKELKASAQRTDKIKVGRAVRKRFEPGTWVASGRRGKGEVVELRNDMRTGKWVAVVRWQSGGQTEEDVSTLNQLRDTVLLKATPPKDDKQLYDEARAKIEKALEGSP